MYTKMKKFTNSFGSDKALVIEFEDEKEKDSFFDLAKRLREESLLFERERDKDAKTSDVDMFIGMLEDRCKPYTDRSSGKTVISTIVFNSEIPDLFCCFYDACGLMYRLGMLFDKAYSMVAGTYVSPKKG